jgi:hypothetical protein
MFGNLSITGFVLAAVLMIPTALFAQIAGAVKPAVHVGCGVSPGWRRRPRYPWPRFGDLALAE